MVEVHRVGSNLDIKGSIFEGERDLCARVMVYGSETWPMKAEEEIRENGAYDG